MAKPISKRERDFAMRVARGEDPVAAMIKAGYSKGTARANGAAFLLRRPRIKEEIERFKSIQGTLKTADRPVYDGLVPELQAVLAEKPLTGEQVEEIKKCADKETGIFYWLKHYVWTWDRANKRKARYPLWPYQREFLTELEKGGKILVEKSRDLMVTWTVCEYMLWHLQFDPYWTGFATSRREAEVDNGGASSTTVSIFGRIRFSWAAQPPWLRMDLRYSHLKIANQENGMFTELTGESANPNVGRSADVFFKWGDEFALVEQSEKAHASMIGGGFHTLLYTSTSNLTGNEFYRLRSKKDSGFRVLRYAWSDRPDRDLKWDKEKTASMTAEQRAKEIDIKYELTGPQRIWGYFDPRIHVVPASEMPSNVGVGIIGYDEGYAHPGALYYARYWNQTLYIVDEVYKSKVQLLNPEPLRDEMETDWVGYIEQLIDKHGDVEAICVGPESRGFEAILTARGYRVYRVGRERLDRIRTVDGLFRGNGKGQPGILINEECVELLREIPNYKWKSVNGLLQDRPADSVDHACDALQYIAEYVMVEHEEVESPEWVSQI